MDSSIELKTEDLINSIPICQFNFKLETIEEENQDNFKDVIESDIKHLNEMINKIKYMFAKKENREHHNKLFIMIVLTIIALILLIFLITVFGVIIFFLIHE